MVIAGRAESSSEGDDVMQRKDLEFATEFLRIFLLLVCRWTGVGWAGGMMRGDLYGCQLWVKVAVDM